MNSDNGSGQIQNFDAYTGGACGQGPIRVLASSFVVPTQLCQPATYSSLQVTAPAPGTYTSGTVAFQDGDAAPIPGQANGTLDGTGTVNLSGRNLSTAAGLPQFLITLAGAQGTPGAVTVKLVWTGTDDPACMAPGTTTSGGHTAGAGACGDTVFIAATGSGQYWKSDTDLSVSPQLTTLYKGIVSKAGHKKVGIRVLNYPATSVDALFAGVNQISERNKITYAKKVTAKLQSNINDYLAGEKQGLAAMWGAYTSVRFSCSPSTKIVLGGYSQGSMVVHEFLNELAATKDKAGKQAVIGAVLLADPERVKYSTVLEMSDAQFGSNGVCDMFSKVVHCAAPDTLSDIAGFYQRTAISVCAFKDPVCDTSDLLSDLTAAVVNTGARKSIINLAMLTHDSYYWLRATTIAGKILGNRVARG